MTEYKKIHDRGILVAQMLVDYGKQLVARPEYENDKRKVAEHIASILQITFEELETMGYGEFTNELYS